LTRHEQKLLLLILSKFNYVNTRVQCQDAARYPKTAQIFDLCTQEKVASTLLQQIEHLTEDEDEALRDSFKNPLIFLSFFPKIIIQLFQQNMGIVTFIGGSQCFTDSLQVALTPKQLLFVITNHIKLVEHPDAQNLRAHMNRKSLPFIQECKNSHLFLFQF